MLEAVERVDASANKLSAKAQQKYVTRFSVNTTNEWCENWSRLDKYLLIKYVDGNVKSENYDVLKYVIGEGGDATHFVENGNGKQIPDKIQFPGYNEKWKRAVAADNGKILEQK